MEALTLDSYVLALQVMAKVAYNFWPCIAFMIGYCVWEHLQQRPVRVRLKTENAKNRYRGDRYRGDSYTHPDCQYPDDSPPSW